MPEIIKFEITDEVSMAIFEKIIVPGLEPKDLHLTLERTSDPIAAFSELAKFSGFVGVRNHYYLSIIIDDK